MYCKPPFGDAGAVYAYLGRYTHRIAISNARLLHVDDHRVRFRTRHGKQATLPAVEFLRRLLLHVLPKGFVRIRHYGLLAAGNVTTKLRAAQQLLRCPSTEVAQREGHSAAADHDGDAPPDYIRLYRELTGIDLRSCPVCHCGRLVPLPLLQPIRRPP